MEDFGRYPLKVRLRGGLGNQMFQFSGAITISRLAKRPLILDVSDLERKSVFTFNFSPRASKKRDFGLDYFDQIKNISGIHEDVAFRIRNWKKPFSTTSIPFKRLITDEEDLTTLNFDGRDVEING